jgi:molybdopterin biosynthesis enzyme
VRSYVPVRLEGTLATTTAVAGIHPLGMLASATALAVIPESVTQVPAGGALEAILLDRRQS